MLDHLREGDTVVVWKLDRLSRSLKDLLTILERVSAAGAKFRSLTESIDTSGPAGRMLMQMLGSFAEFEREMIRERTRAGLHEARAQGRVPGRKPKITAEQKKEIVEAVSSGRKTPAEIDILRQLSRIADRAIAGAYGAVAAGSTEMDIAAALTRGVYEAGAEYFKLMIVATGERSVFPNVGPTARVLKREDICRVEIFPMIGGYHAGVCRTAAVGAPPTCTSPSLGFSKRPAMCSRVDLPAPDGAISATDWPGQSVSSAPFSTSTTVSPSP